MLVVVPFRCPSIICSFWLLRWFDDGGDSDVDVEWMNERQTERVNATKISQLLVENNVVWIVNVVCAKVCSCVGAQRIHNTTKFFFLILHLFSWLVHEFCSPGSKHLRKCRIFTYNSHGQNFPTVCMHHHHHNKNKIQKKKNNYNHNNNINDDELRKKDKKKRNEPSYNKQKMFNKFYWKRVRENKEGL